MTCVVGGDSSGGSGQTCKNDGVAGVLDINGQLFIKVDDSAIIADVKTLEEAIAMLVMYHYVLDINFPSTLKIFYGFLERLFQMTPTSESVNIKRLCAFLNLDTSITDG